MIQNEQSVLQKVSDILKKGGVVVFPTDTVFGIGCLPEHEDAIKRIFAIKKRPLEKTLPLLVLDAEMAKRYVSFPSQEAEETISTHWPGAFTFILPSHRKNVSPLLEKKGTMAVRMPNQPFLLQLMKNLQSPLVATSANLAGEKPVCDSSLLSSAIREAVDFVVEEVSGSGNPSTIIDCTKTPFVVIREG